MGYKASDQISKLDYDFRPYAEVSGTTPEFPDDHIQGYWEGFSAMLRRNRDALREWEVRRSALQDEANEAKDEDSLAALKALDDEYEAWTKENTVKLREVRRRLLAMLCSDQPSVEELAQLPGRVFDSFESAMQEELSPKE